jgi:hypothetical protein
MIFNSTSRAARLAGRSASARSRMRFACSATSRALGDRQQRSTGELDRPMDAGTVLRRGVTGQFLQF